MITGEVEAVDRKQKIRDRYKGVDISELEVIPAKIIEDLETSSVIRRVAAYIRVSTDNDEQTSSYELQKNYYELIKRIYVGMDNSVEVEFKCSDPYQEVLAIMSEVQNE